MLPWNCGDSRTGVGGQFFAGNPSYPMRERFRTIPGGGGELPPIALPGAERARDPLVDVADPKHRDVLEKLEAGYERATTDEGMRAYLRVVSKLHTYSPRNVRLIYAQDPDATMVMGYGDKEGKTGWKSIGRQVRKGETGIQIFRPSKRYVTEEDELTGEKSRREIVTGFSLTSVFDVRQTDGAPIPEPPTPSMRFGATEVAKLLDRKLSLWLIGQGVHLEKTATPSRRGSFDSTTKRIVLNELLPDDDGKLKTLTHEAGHYLAGHHGSDPAKRPVAELIAEGSACATLGYFGIDTTGYSIPYLVYWGKTPEMIKEALPEIARVTRTMIAGIEGERPDGEEAWL